jgi:hypothetical protein
VSTVETATDTPQFVVQFDDPDNAERKKRPWHELYPNAKAFVDGTIDAFMDAYGKEDKGFTRKLTNYEIPLERDSEHPNMRAVRLLNDRCTARKVNCHSVIKNGNVHMVVGKRIVKKRKPRAAATETTPETTAGE